MSGPGFERGVQYPGWDELGPPDEVVSTEFGIHCYWNLGPYDDESDGYEPDFDDEDDSEGWDDEEDYPEEW